MAGFAPERVIYVGSLSKLLLPALRIGYIVAPAKVVDSLAQQVMLLDSMGNTLTEDAAADLIESGEVRRHVRKVTQIYAQRRKAFAAMLAEELGGLADFEVPDGGLAFWVRFRNLKALDAIEQPAARRRGCLRRAAHRYRPEAPSGSSARAAISLGPRTAPTPAAISQHLV